MKKEPKKTSLEKEMDNVFAKVSKTELKSAPSTRRTEYTEGDVGYSLF